MDLGVEAFGEFSEALAGDADLVGACRVVAGQVANESMRWLMSWATAASSSTALAICTAMSLMRWLKWVLCSSRMQPCWDVCCECAGRYQVIVQGKGFGSTCLVLRRSRAANLDRTPAPRFRNI
tara:strand:+ start:1906 stop:2277 length:372 start_codon:yes stop_codon:yes gene_type:complete